ncbi:Fpg/Nei family DNA glycosylase [Paenibacillus nanensis]|uniref:Formamidopyrimidine-DNA glycosylase n=1 Tax=Paenibacillus nanensis TaxID=393251 RepID=A0A3A1UYP0_9BACL|nr:DNA-formamidopyrimidine glycosylase family protein [Paenibacillus nanensis]RIX53607.1 Fpg/Nei family DNA glycosylase [Paenibacillus nanensis]
MQELPELDIYRAMIAERFAGAQITGMTIHSDQLFQDGQASEQDIVGQTIWFVERRAQHLIFHLDNGKRLLIHLSEGANVYSSSVSPEETEDPSQASIVIRFGERQLAFYGLRAGDAALMSVKSLEAYMKEFGPDPLDKRLTLNRFIERFAKKRSALKTALIDDRIISGIGTVYSDEIAFEARLRPEVKVSSLNQEEWERLYAAVGTVLRDSITHGGAASKPLFEGDILTGGYAERLRVYNRDGHACERCGGTVRKLTVGGRKAYACDTCQEAGAAPSSRDNAEPN